MISKMLVSTGISFWLMGKLAAMSVLPYDRNYKQVTTIKIKETNSNNCWLTYSDLSHSEYLRSLNIQATEDGVTKIIPDLQTHLLKITEICETAANKAAKPKESDNEFTTNWQNQVISALSSSTDYHAILGCKDKVLKVPTEIDPNILRIVLYMRKRLYLNLTLISKGRFEEVLKLYKFLNFEDGSYIDFFIEDPFEDIPRHVVIERNVLFAINYAAQLHLLNKLEYFKKLIFNASNNLSLSSREYYHNKCYEVIKDMDKLKYTISLLGIETDANNQIQDIVLSHDSITFEYGKINTASEKYFLQPRLSHSGEAHLKASVFAIFDQLGVFNSVEQLRVICYSDMEKYTGSFYSNLVHVMPSLRHIEVNEIIKPDEAKSRMKADRYAYNGMKTAINDILDQLLEPADALRNITTFNIAGYTRLTRRFINKLKSARLEGVGLFGRYMVRDLYYNYLLLSDECTLSKSITSYTGSLNGLFLAVELLGDRQLKNVVVNLSEQLVVFGQEPSEISLGVKEEMAKYFEDGSLLAPVIRRKMYLFESMWIIPRQE
ncbi:hypothetical protein ENBRE01_0371 [Enteropsectra breve]|nr:hypothetical protein ENBRE01_0371 [Enteropsectra breve]